MTSATAPGIAPDSTSARNASLNLRSRAGENPAAAGSGADAALKAEASNVISDMRVVEGLRLVGKSQGEKIPPRRQTL
jgi:hypothetical protein